MNRQDSFHYLKKNIPMAEAMDIRLESDTPEKLILSAPYGQNRNHHGSAFGGSIVTLMILAGWLRVQTILDEHFPHSLAVIARNEVSYRSPIEGDIFARVHPIGQEVLDLFRERLEKKGKAVIEVEVSAGSSPDMLDSADWLDRAAARFTGTFVGMLQ